MGEVISLDAKRQGPGYWGQYEPRRQGRRERWGCVDERFLQLIAALLKGEISPDPAARITANDKDDNLHRLYLQIPGGPVGMAHARATAMEAQKRRSFVQLGQSVTVLAGISAKIALDENVELVRHGSTDKDICGRETYALEAAQTTIDRGEDVLRIAQTIYPPLDSNEYETHTDANKRMLQAGLIETGELDIPAVPRLALLQEPHIATRFTVNHGRAAFDSQRAWELGDPSYQLSFGRLPEIHRDLNQYLGPIDEHHFLSAVAIDGAATAWVLARRTGVEFDYQVVNVS